MDELYEVIEWKYIFRKIILKLKKQLQKKEFELEELLQQQRHTDYENQTKIKELETEIKSYKRNDYHSEEKINQDAEIRVDLGDEDEILKSQLTSIEDKLKSCLKNLESQNNDLLAQLKTYKHRGSFNITLENEKMQQNSAHVYLIKYLIFFFILGFWKFPWI